MRETKLTASFEHRLAPAALAILAGLTWMIGCERAPLEQDDGLVPTLTSIQANVFDVTCALSGCHVGPAAPHALDLSQGQSRANLVNVASQQVTQLLRVQPGSPDDSYLIIKLEGNARIAPGTDRMPLGRPPLSAGEIAVIRQWISEGAGE